MITGGSLSPLLVDHSVTTRFEVISVPGARAAARALGGSRNDLLVAGAASGLGLYHERLGFPCDELRLATPTSQRRGHDVGGNWFAPARVAVPTAAGPLGPHFEVVADRLTQARVEPALRFAPALASTISYLPAQVLIPALQAQAGTVDFVATAIPGIRGSGRICGARIETSYPFGPRLGCPVNLTAFGNNDRLDVGIALDPAAITEPAVFLECLDEAFAGLVPRSGARVARVRARSRTHALPPSASPDPDAVRGSEGPRAAGPVQPAAAGGVRVDAQSCAVCARRPEASRRDPYADLKGLAELHRSGVLTDAEFAAAKAKVLDTEDDPA